MYMQLDVFADLLRVRSEELLHAVRTTGELDGMRLPVRIQVRGAAVMFERPRPWILQRDGTVGNRITTPIPLEHR